MNRELQNKVEEVESIVNQIEEQKGSMNQLSCLQQELEIVNEEKETLMLEVRHLKLMLKQQ